MFEKLDHIETKYQELTDALASPEIVSDSAKYQKTAKAHSEIAPVVEKYREFKDLRRGIAESKEMLASETDADMKAYAEEELAQLEERLLKVEEELKVLLIPKDPNDDKNVILEIRAGTGGDEASLFAGRAVPHVHPVRGNAALEGRSAFDVGIGSGRLEGSDRVGDWPWRVFTSEV